MTTYLLPRSASVLQWRAASLGFLLGLSAFGGGVLILRTADVDANQERGCSFPRNEGEATMAWIEEGKFKCWRFR